MRRAPTGLWLPDEHVKPCDIGAYRWGKMTAAQREQAVEMGFRPPIGGGAAKTYTVYNGATAALTAAMPAVATGTSIKTMLQAATPAATGLRVIEWGAFFTQAQASAVLVELIETDVAATITQFAAGDIVKMNGPNDAASQIVTGSNTSSGYTATAEGSITATRLGDYQPITMGFDKQLPLGREFEVRVSKFLRVRATASVSANMVTWVTWEE